MGAHPTRGENADFATALAAYSDCGDPDDFSALTAFLEDHPRSSWNGALLTNLGLVYYSRGYYSRAVRAWDLACAIARTVTDPAQQPLADRAFGELAYLLARIGRVSELSALLQSVEGRPFCGPATEKIAGARAGLADMRGRPEVSFRCGPLALHRIMLAVHPENPRTELIAQSVSAPDGFTLSQLAELSQRLGLHYQAAFRPPGADLVIPSVVHLAVDHFAAVVRREGDRYLLEDPTFKRDAWVTQATLDAEASGYFLIPAGGRPRGWRSVAAGEAGSVRGRGNVPNAPDPPGPCDPSTDSCGACADGMAVPRVYLLDVSLSLTDKPTGYAPPVGPQVPFTVRYRQRDNQFSSTFNYSNFGPKWTFDWLAYIIDDPATPQADVTYYMRGGGNRTFTGFNATTQAFAYQVIDRTLLTRTSGTSYQLLSPDGTLLVFGQSDGGVATRRIFLTEVIDPAGQAVSLAYDADLRITTITDAIGQQTTLTYGNTADAFKITTVTDPFGRSAVFGYSAAGQLTSITDTLGLVSAFSYDATTTDLVTTLTTPYGVTTFTNAENGTTRSMEVLYPDGNRERVEFNQGTTLGIAGSDPQETVPSGMETTNEYLYYRNTYHWDRQGCAYAYGDYTKARIYHWLHSADLQSPVGILESTKAPLEGRVWYDYAGQTTSNGSIVIGSTSRPTHTGRVLDDGSTQLYYREYNDFGNVTKTVDPVGRTFSYRYDANGIDLLETRQTRAGQGALIRQMSYNAQHQPLTSADAAGQTTTCVYNARGQLATVTDPLGRTTSYQYDAHGYLTSLTGPLGATDTTAWTYDSSGRIKTITDNDGYMLAFEYDRLDRITKVTGPDSTFYQISYTLLDRTSIMDRAGRQTNFEYNSVRQLTKRTDPLNRVTLFEWCRCGALRRVADPLGRGTTWRHDIQGRVKTKEYADGSRVDYVFEGTTSRLRQRIDGSLRISQYSYNRDDTLAQKLFLNAPVITPVVSFAYDQNYRRPISVTGGTGTSNYTYVPITPSPALGAGRLGQVSLPAPDGTIVYGYDELGRRVSTAFNGRESTVKFDAAGRIASSVNALGIFTYTYEGDSFRLASQSSPNGQLSEYAYGDNDHDRALLQITHSNGPNAVSQFIYAYDQPTGQVSSWSQQPGTETPTIFSFEYDAANELTSAAGTQGGNATSAVAYTYDAAGNRLSQQTGADVVHATCNALNQLMSTDQASGTQAAYQWDSDNRLTGVSTGNKETQLTYDGYGRISVIRQVVNQAETSYRRFVWSGGQIREERNADGSLARQYFAQGMAIENGATTESYYYTRDELGSIREVTDSSGTLQARYSYDFFGQPTKLTGGIDADFGFAGMFWSSEIGLNMTRFRPYDPGTGRWLSRDPLENAEVLQGPSLYAYAGNNTVNWTDRSGLQWWKQAAGVVFKLWQWGTVGDEDTPEETPQTNPGPETPGASGPSGGPPSGGGPPDGGPPDDDNDGGSPPGGAPGGAATGPEGTGACCDPGSGSGPDPGSDGKTAAAIVAVGAAGGILGLTWPELAGICVLGL